MLANENICGVQPNLYIIGSYTGCMWYPNDCSGILTPCCSQCSIEWACRLAVASLSKAGYFGSGTSVCVRNYLRLVCLVLFSLNFFLVQETNCDQGPVATGRNSSAKDGKSKNIYVLSRNNGTRLAGLVLSDPRIRYTFSQVSTRIPLYGLPLPADGIGNSASSYTVLWRPLRLRNCMSTCHFHYLVSRC